MLLDVTKLKADLEYNVKEDIKEFSKPALMYYYHHANKTINCLDTIEQWKAEQENLQTQNLKYKQIEKTVKIGKDEWKVIIWTFQPLDENGKIDEKKFNKLTNILYDPLAMAHSYLVSGFCYLQFIEKL